MDDASLDHSGTGMNRELRALYSDLTNCLYAMQTKSCSVSDVLAIVKKIQDLQPERREGYLWLEAQLYTCAVYWEEPLRYEVCWPLLQKILQDRSVKPE